MKRPGLQDLKNKFAVLLLKWNEKQNSRQMPWKGEKDPYRIWLSEIILQQTRVEQGLHYYTRFIGAFPDIHKLARADDNKIFKLWEGLGYYTRCRNLIATARYISKELKGEFPAAYEQLKALKGVGPYTASAIASFAFNQPHAVVDGNVFRVLSRLFGISIPLDSAEGKKLFTSLANELLDKKHPGLYNQAIMDFGAVICKPAPLCPHCIFNSSCWAYQNDKVKELPVKEKRTRIKKRWFYYFVMEHGNKIAVRQRVEKDIWQQLFEFPLVESDVLLARNKILNKAEKLGLLENNNYEVKEISPLITQQLSHQLIAGKFVSVRIHQRSKFDNTWTWISKNKIGQYAFPGFINQYISKKTDHSTI